MFGEGFDVKGLWCRVYGPRLIIHNLELRVQGTSNCFGRRVRLCLGERKLIKVPKGQQSSTSSQSPTCVPGNGFESGDWVIAKKSNLLYGYTSLFCDAMGSYERPPVSIVNVHMKLEGRWRKFPDTTTVV